MIPDGNRIIERAIAIVRGGGQLHPLTILAVVFAGDDDAAAHANAILQTVNASGFRTLEEWWRQKVRTEAEVIQLFETAMVTEARRAG